MGTITLLDGGMGKELRRMGAPFRQPEWSALALMEDPDAVVRAHTNFIAAGADVITTNNYAVVPFHLGDELVAARGADLVTLAGRLARQAADTANDSSAAGDRSVRVAGSLPPLFGSYEPDRFDPARAPALYSMIIDSLDPFVDLWLAETLSVVAELDVIADVLGSHGSHGSQRPLWVSFALPNHTNGQIALRSGDTIDDIVDGAGRAGADAVMFNCSLPEQIGPALEELHSKLSTALPGARTGGYANAFPDELPVASSANTNIFEPRTDLDPTAYADFVDGWVDGGATIIGGCCDIYPEHIAELARRHTTHEFGS